MRYAGPVLVALLALSAGCVVATDAPRSAADTPASPTDASRSAVGGPPSVADSPTGTSATIVESAEGDRSPPPTPTISTACRRTDSTESSRQSSVNALTTGAPELTVETAITRALCAEERYLRQQLQQANCVDSWGAYDAGGSPDEEGTVVNRTSNGIYVDVQHPYWWGNSEVSDDSFSTATYLVIGNRTRRVSGRAVEPC